LACLVGLACLVCFSPAATFLPYDIPTNLLEALRRETAVVKQNSREAVGLIPTLFDQIMIIIRDLLDYGRCFRSSFFLSCLNFNFIVLPLFLYPDE
jgi:hypothetical protein